MADLLTTFGSDNRQARRGIRQVREEVTDLQRAMRQSTQVSGGASAREVVQTFATVGFGIQAVRKMLVGAAEATRQYAEEYPFLAEQMKGAEAASRDFSMGVGRDLTVTMGRFNGLLDGTLDRLGTLRGDLATTAAAMLGMDSHGANRFIAGAEADEARQKAQVELARVRTDAAMAEKRAALDAAKARGDSLGAARLELELRKEAIAAEASARRKAAGEAGLSGQAMRQAQEAIDAAKAAQTAAAEAAFDAARAPKRRSALQSELASIDQAARAGSLETDPRRAELGRAMVGMMRERARIAHDELLTDRTRAHQLEVLEAHYRRQVALINEQHDAAEALAERQEEANRTAARRAVADGQVRRAIEVARLSGLDREAEAMELRARFAREAREIEHTDLLPVEQKAAALRDLAQSERTITGLRMQRTRNDREFTRERGAGVGLLGGANQVAQQIGARAQERTADAAAKTNEGVRRLLDTADKILQQMKEQPAGAVLL